MFNKLHSKIINPNGWCICSSGRFSRDLGEIPGIGPIDPWLARDLAAAAARNPKTTWCVTVTDERGHAVAHGCAQPEPKRHRKRAGPETRDGPGFSFTATAEPGTWQLRIPAGPDLLVRFEPINTRKCDHRFQAKGHDPGVKLRHLTQVRHGPAPDRDAASRCTMRLRAQHPV